VLKKIKHLTLALPLAVGALSVQAKPLSLERIFDDPSLSGKAPVQLKFSPDGSRVTYLQGKTDDYNRYDLWEYNLKDNTNRILVDSAKLFSGPENLSDEEKARRERQRIFGKGILEYKWSKDGKALLFHSHSMVTCIITSLHLVKVKNLPIQKRLKPMPVFLLKVTMYRLFASKTFML